MITITKIIAEGKDGSITAKYHEDSSYYPKSNSNYSKWTYTVKIEGKTTILYVWTRKNVELMFNRVDRITKGLPEKIATLIKWHIQEENGGWYPRFN